jgi:RsiW-degrading membrane proteinase PrsW (M82 family)
VSPLSLAVGFLPVLLLLGGLLAADSFKLVTRRQVLVAILWGAGAAAVSFVLNRLLLDPAGVPPVFLRRYLAPLIEETLKAAPIFSLIAASRVGFLVDAALLGLASGTGFALVENAWYAHALGDTNPWLWVVRGLGTAVLHASTTALAAIVAKALLDRAPRQRARAWLLALAPSIVMHSAYNHLAVNPFIATIVLVVGMPLALVSAFEWSERSTREWLGTGLDRDAELLDLVHSGAIVHSPAGEYLSSLRTRFDGPVVADMLCLLEIRLELAMRAKGLLLAREAGLEVPPEKEVIANLEEMRYLERAIGPVGRLAMHPLLPEGRERWQIRLLEGRGTGSGKRS